MSLRILGDMKEGGTFPGARVGVGTRDACLEMLNLRCLFVEEMEGVEYKQ